MTKERKARDPEYQDFLDYISGRKNDGLAKNSATQATDQEIGWWKKEQIRQAINQARHGIATPEQLDLLKNKKVAIPNRAHQRTRKKVRSSNY